MSLEMASTPAFTVVFPAPPPTSNVLTASQRAQLLRTTKKLGRILGVAPRLLDAETLPPAAQQQHAQACHVPVFSISRPASPISLKRNLPVSHRRSTSCSSAHRCSSPLGDSSPAAPVLRLALPPAGSPSACAGAPSSPRGNAFTLVPAGRAGKENAARGGMSASGVTASAFRGMSARGGIASTSRGTSVSALRRRKLDRLRHTLGEGVPQDLIFPPSSPQEFILPPGGRDVSSVGKTAGRAYEWDGQPAERERPSIERGRAFIERKRGRVIEQLRETSERTRGIDQRMPSNNELASDSDELGTDASDLRGGFDELGTEAHQALDRDALPARPTTALGVRRDNLVSLATRSNTDLLDDLDEKPPAWSAFDDLPPTWSVSLPALWCAPDAHVPQWSRTPARLDVIIESDDEE
ncbi:hypothetical protein BD626DRAFT_571347 [Schizophyllum amplum]|uniref:Uncharacterized protein n=1 Tax=Schizophyllum amplum TaxID=97359 RepID=A0A550C830_9AGAR|nr:hypothetical protein BD626DRAFT_571347 [Auriculariopsis ampla]